MFKKLWVVKATCLHEYETAEADVRLMQMYASKDDANKVYAHGKKAEIANLHWELEPAYMIEDVDFGIHMADKLVEEMKGERE